MKRIIAVLLTVLLFLFGCNSEPGQSDKKAAAGFLQKAKLKKQKISPVTNPKAAPTNIFAISV